MGLPMNALTSPHVKARRTISLGSAAVPNLPSLYPAGRKRKFSREDFSAIGMLIQSSSESVWLVATYETPIPWNEGWTTGFDDLDIDIDSLLHPLLCRLVIQVADMQECSVERDKIIVRGVVAEAYNTLNLAADPARERPLDGVVLARNGNITPIA